MSRCTAVKADGSNCQAPALRADPDCRCVFHSKLTFPAANRSHDFTKPEAVRTVGREIRALRRDKALKGIARAETIRNLILLWQSLTAPEAEPPPGFSYPQPLEYRDRRLSIS
jgi:hypothetical protein